MFCVCWFLPTVTHIQMYIHMYVRMHVCMYVCACMRACMYVCMYVCMYACMYVRVYIYMYVYVCVRVRACACVYVHVYIITKFLVISKYITGAILCLPLDLPPNSKLYVILAICYERKCVTVAAILNIN